MIAVSYFAAIGHCFFFNFFIWLPTTLRVIVMVIGAARPQDPMFCSPLSWFFRFHSTAFTAVRVYEFPFPAVLANVPFSEW
jgi:hypothetical protein